MYYGILLLAFGIILRLVASLVGVQYSLHFKKREHQRELQGGGKYMLKARSKQCNKALQYSIMVLMHFDIYRTRAKKCPDVIIQSVYNETSCF
jgi:hypothetical protein